MINISTSENFDKAFKLIDLCDEKLDPEVWKYEIHCSSLSKSYVKIVKFYFINEEDMFLMLLMV